MITFSTEIYQIGPILPGNNFLLITGSFCTMLALFYMIQLNMVDRANP